MAKAKAGSAEDDPGPQPKRAVPFFVQEAHEVRVGNELDTDWTLSADWSEEMKLREERNLLIKAQLIAGKTVAYRSSGWSLYPKVHSNDICFFLPVKFDESIAEDDVVFCNVQPIGVFLRPSCEAEGVAQRPPLLEVLDQ